ncbi:NB-ARC domains-containing protein [Tanacetum coccineum]
MVVKQTENYEATFGKHEKLVNRDVSKWKEALIKAVSLPGWDLQRLANGHSHIIKNLLCLLGLFTLKLGKLVGVHSRAKEMNLLQFVGSSKVHMIGVCGVGGIGKTSIAKAVYNRLYAHFEVCSFCEDVNEFVTKFGMVQLQRQIIEDMTKEDLKISSVGEGSNAIKKIMLSKKVLLILDDVHERDHLEALAGSHGWFGSGSLILITGKDRQLLIAHGVEKVYDVELLHDDEAMELFNLCAFNHKQRKDDFRELSEQLVPYMKGHPLALKVLGCFLFGKTVCEWESELRRLERYPTDDIKVLISRFSLNKKRKTRIEDYLYQNKLHEPLSETKPSGIKQEDWALLDRQALGVVRLSLAKNVAFNVLNEKTTFGLLKGLSNMYERPSASKKVFLIKQLVNTKMTEGATVADHINEFNSVISKLLSVDIMFDDEMQALLLLSSLPDSWSGSVTVVGSTSGRRSKCEDAKGVVNVSMDAFDDALLCCIEEYCESWVMDSGASLHATPCVGMMNNFKPLLGKVCLADRKVLDVTDNKGYHIGFDDQMWKVTIGGQIIARGCKRGTLYMVEILVTEWSGGNLIEDVYKETEKKNSINERLCRKLYMRLCNRFRVKLYNRLRVQIYAHLAELREKSTREPLRLDLVCHGMLSNIVESLGTNKFSGTKGSVKASGRLGASGSSVNRLSLYVCTNMSVKAFSQVNFDEYICVAISKGILIAGKEDQACVEILYGWVVGFDEVLVAESNMTKVSKLKRWFSLEKNSAVSELGEASTCLLKN